MSQAPMTGRRDHATGIGASIRPAYGAWTYPPQATIGLVNLICAGLLRLDSFEATTFDLDHANDAVAHAASNSGPFKMTVIRA
jgi:hypothetical protein